MRRAFMLFFMISMSGILAAHEFWLEPDKFYFKAGEKATISFKVGENFMGDLWKVKAERILRMEDHTSTGILNLKKMLKEDTDDPFEIDLSAGGSHVVVMESNAAFIRLDGKTFTEYLEEDGLDEVLYEREKEGIAADSASEHYSRHTKLILQSGTLSDDRYKKVCNLPVEIIPEQNPLAMKKGDRISFRILFRGKPLFGAKVKVFNRYNHRTSLQNIFSQQDGRIETHVSNPGYWMVSVVKMIPSQDPSAQYRSYWGSLVFGVR